MIYIPNLLSLTRIGLVPILLVLLQSHQYAWALCVFMLAGITDGLDGYIARRFDAKTKLGALLDPIADKCLLVASYVMLGSLSLIPFWLMIVVVFRDIVIVSGYLLLVIFFGKIEIRPLLISRVNTVLQIFYILLVLMTLAQFFEIGAFEIGAFKIEPFEIDLLLSILSYIVLITSVTSGVAYVVIGSIKATTEAQGRGNSRD